MTSGHRKNEVVVLVHGIWMKGPEFFRLSYNLRKQGYQTCHFVYRSLFRTPQQNATQLDKFLEKINKPVIHLVCHSLGGIVAMHMINQAKQHRLGKIILLGTPVNGSAVANQIYRRSWSRWLLGKSVVNGLLGNIPHPEIGRDISMIAGFQGLGAGRFLAAKAIKPQNDGTVNLDETQAPFIRQHIAVPHGHFALLWSKEVINKVIDLLNVSQNF